MRIMVNTLTNLFAASAFALPSQAPTMLKATKRIQDRAPSHTPKTCPGADLCSFGFGRGRSRRFVVLSHSRGRSRGTPLTSHAAAHDQQIRTRRSEFHGYVQR